MANSPTLWEVLLYPQGTDLLPLAGSQEWTARAQALQAWLSANGMRRRIRSPWALWALLQRTPVPAGATWDALMHGTDAQALLAALAPTAEVTVRGIVTWNVRWMVDQHSMTSRDKFVRVKGWLDTGNVVLLQETHWSEVDAAL